MKYGFFGKNKFAVLPVLVFSALNGAGLPGNKKTGLLYGPVLICRNIIPTTQVF